MYNFTFQPGYIQMDGTSLGTYEYINFTFQPGYIQIIFDRASIRPVKALHSNLVIFKSESYNTIYSRHFKPHFLSTRIFTSTELLWRVYFITIKYPFTFIL